MANRSGEVRTARAREKSDAIFTLYWQMGPERSLSKLVKLCTMVGIRTAESTIKRWSQRHEWQRRILELDRKVREEREARAIEEVTDMNTRHVKIAQGMLRMAYAGILQFHKAIQQSEDGALKMTVDDIVKLYRAAQTGERLARGEATSRVEVWVDILETVVREFGLIFMAVNEVAAKEEREQEYIRLSDDMLRRYYREKVKEAEEPRIGGDETYGN